MKYRVDRNGDQKPTCDRMVVQATDVIVTAKGLTLSIIHVLCLMGDGSIQKGFKFLIEGERFGSNMNHLQIGTDEATYNRTLIHGYEVLVGQLMLG